MPAQTVFHGTRRGWDVGLQSMDIVAIDSTIELSNNQITAQDDGIAGGQGGDSITR